MKLKAAFIFILSFNLSLSFACTNILIKAKDGAVVIGRTLEFGPPLDSEIITSPKGRKFTNKALNGQESQSWTAKYGYVYLNFFHQDHAVDGMNEKGLSMGFLYLPGFTDYPEATNENVKQGIPYYQLGDWILSQFETVEEVKAKLSRLIVFGQDLDVPQQGKVTFPVHVIVNDSKGKSIVIEFNKKDMQVYDNPLGILTNAPTFDWHINNLKNYTNLSPYAVEPIKEDGITYSATSQGAGMFGLPGDSTSPSRFVKMAFLQTTALPVENAEKAVVLAHHIIENVFIPNGMVRNPKGSAGTETTQWTVFKDLKNAKLYFKSYDYPMLQSIDLKKLDLGENARVLRLPVNHQAELSKDVTEIIAGKA
ncbi:linear amide C-N hydrolase [Legionella londiniensis]|uniref:Choloylglycine hydrolase n=1 Tax=Legionella londiniensis TaxID=45068 RepID=A0A0W0VKJ4_9GAMM|nr:choloylglycine hydrolase family protein [Legionella londiniensis]KTD20345.1 Choloylglycine hydrolase [Legionella londiniensis]STX93948.1 Penicillin V acylase and related amidases [Legionella londiniensis]